MDERLNLAASLYTPGEVGADIGTDHGYLPITLVKTGVCKRMIAADISEKALAHARENVNKHHLENCIDLKVSDGLRALDEPVGTISITGMGGQLIAKILREGRA